MYVLVMSAFSEVFFSCSTTALVACLRRSSDRLAASVAVQGAREGFRNQGEENGVYKI
jgi:hypothetical protein